MPYTKQQENFFRLLTLICMHGTHICRQLLQKCINTTSLEFEDFINDHQHKIYHFYNRNHCCQCDENPKLPERTILVGTQMLIIFNKDSNRLDKHETQKNRELCCLKANEKVNLEALDLTFVRFFLFNFCTKLVWEIYLPHSEKNFESFMNENVHKVYHLAHQNVCCCKCNSDRDIPDKNLRITKDMFGILFEIVDTACQSECSCQYKIKKDITFSSLVNGDNTLFTVLTWCLCLNHPQSINSIRNKIMHKIDPRINDDEFKEFWDITENNILGIAKALDLHDDYAKQLQELKKECNNTYCETALVEWLKKTKQVPEYMLQTIYNSKEEHKVGHILECLNKLTIRGCCADFEENLNEFTKAAVERDLPEISSDHLNDTEIQLTIRTTGGDTCNPDSDMSEDSSSNEDETNDTITCGPCQQNFTKLVEFTKHIKICSKNITNTYIHKIKKQAIEFSEKLRKKKATKRNPRKRRLYQMKYTQVGNRWITEVKKKIKREPELLDTEDTYVYHMETSCLIVWAESSQSEKESSDQIKERCIQFTENMFKKCPLDSLETVEVDVTVTFSELFEESDSENDDLFECGICGHVFHTINSFLVHKKNCRRHRKRRRGSKGDDKLVQNSKKIKIDEISQEEENFLRIAVLITRVATDAVRIVFDRELQGGALKGTLIEEPKVLDDLERKRIILPFQWQLIFPKSGQASSYSLNLKIMACLIQVLQTKYVDEKLPTDQNDFSIEADLSRLLYYRRVIARSTDTKLEKEKMDEYWMVISGVIERLGGKGFRHQCNELKVSNFNVHYIEMLTEIKEIAKKDNSYTQGFNRILDYIFDIGTNEATSRTATSISQEEANFLLIAHLLLKIAPSAIRIIFDKEFDPDVLQNELRKRSHELIKLKSNGNLNPAQWDKLFPRKDKPKSADFDLSLMIFLIGKYTDIQVSKQLPVENKSEDKSESTNISPDISTIMYYWMEIAGRQDFFLSNRTFEEYWTAITKAIKNIGGTDFQKRCIELKNQTLKQNNIDISNVVEYKSTSNVPALKDNN